jgi:GNAT superfamily N-acetyltransferase
VGAAVLYRPGTYPLPALSRLLAVGRHLLQCGTHGLSRWRQLQAADAQHRRPEPHFRVALLGVTPEHQRQGLGAQLLQHCVDLADRANAGVVLPSANPRHAALYAGFGFEADVETDAAGVGVSYLWRPVQPRSRRLEEAAVPQEVAAEPAAAGQLLAAAG